VRGARNEHYVPSSASTRTSFSAAMAHDRELDGLITRPSLGQTFADFLIFCTTLVFPGMAAYVVGGWDVQPPVCVLALDNARIQNEVTPEGVTAASVFLLFFPAYPLEFYPMEDVFFVCSSSIRR